MTHWPRTARKTDNAGNRQLTGGWSLSRIEKLYRRSRLFDWQMRVTPPSLPLPVLSDPWRGNARIGAQIIQGQMPLSPASVDFARFGWLRDMRDYGGSGARLSARAMIDRWMKDNWYWSAASWRPDVMGDRLATLILTYGWFGASADEAFQQRFALMIARQARCLAMDWQRLHTQMDQLTALKGLILSQAVLASGGNSRRRDYGINALLDIVIPKARGQLLPDGGHRSRQPEIHLKLLRLLLECRTAVTSLAVSDMPAIEDIIQKMAAIARIWRHPDGGFAHFHFAGAMPLDDIEQIITRASSKGAIPPHAADTGIARLSAARTVLIADTGPVSEARQSARAGTTQPYPMAGGLFAFECSVASSRFIVNSGQSVADPRLRAALSQSAAHSTLTLDGLDNCSAQTSTIAFEMGPAAGGQLLHATHDGYLKSHGILHTRQIFLSQSGSQIKGSDRLHYSGAPGQIPVELIIRFHLHPRVSAARVRDSHILLKLRGQKSGWLFKCRGATALLDTSLYIEAERRNSCQQIVLRCPASEIQTKGEITVNWGFTRHSSKI